MNQKRSLITRRGFLKGAAGAILGAGLAGCGQPTPAPSPTSTPTAGPFVPSLRILWTGDTHGHLTPAYHREPFGESFLKENGIERGSEKAYLGSELDYLDLAKKYGKVGGYAHLATLIAKERAALPSLLLDAGDAWYGSAIALLTEGKALVEVMNALGYDAMTMHWEFNLGKKALLQRIGEAKFAVLAQNLIDTDFGDRILTPSIVKEMGGIKVGIVGQAYPFSLLTTESRDANPGWRMGYQEDTLQKEITQLRKEKGAQIVILLSHMGYDQDRVFADMLNGVDVIVGSHTHDILWKPTQVKNTLIVQAGSQGKFLGELDLGFRNGKVDGFRHQLIPVIASTVEPDSTVNALITKLYQPYQEQLSKVVGESKSVLYRRSTFGGTTDAYMVKAYKEIAGSQVGCAPGWRFGSTAVPGPITVEDVYNVMKPTASPLYKVRLSGRQMRAAMEDNLDNVFNADPLQRLGGDTLRCGSVKISLRRSAPREKRVVSMTVNDAPLNEDTKYEIATSGGRTQYLDPDVQATPKPAVEELLNYIKANPSIASNEPVQTFTEVS